MTRRNLLAAVALVTAIAGVSLADEPPKPAGVSPQTAFINEQLAKAWKANNLKPSNKADDYEFCRRVFLDLIGRIPRP